MIVNIVETTIRMTIPTSKKSISPCGGSWVVSGVISPLIAVMVTVTVTLLITPLTTTHEPPSRSGAFAPAWLWE